MTTRPLQIRWCIESDLPRVVAIDAESFPSESHWSQDDFLEFFRTWPNIIMVAETPDDRGFLHVAGFIAYELRAKSLHVANVAVAPLFRRLGVGRALLERLIDKLCQQRREYLELYVCERNLAAQLWLRACGFGAIRVEHAHFEHADGGPEDAIVFRRYWMEREEPPPANPPYSPDELYEPSSERTKQIVENWREDSLDFETHNPLEEDDL